MPLLFVFFLLLSSTTAALATPARSECDSRFTRVQVAPMIYMPFATHDATLAVEFEVENTQGCQTSLYLSNDQGGLQGVGGNLRYNLRGSAGQILTRAMPLPLATAKSGSGWRVLASVPAGQASLPGIYRDTLVMQLRHGEQVLDQIEARLAVQVVAQARIAAAGSASAGFSSAHGARLDFGTLTPGKEREAFLFVQSNGAYLLRLRSENSGALRHERAADTIRYSSFLDGRLVDLSQPASVPGRPPSLVQPPFALRARIGETSGKLAGDYRDVITVDVILLE
ncbi:hypothetical protein GCM10027343_24600 [Noviherbaspirillum agri]